MEIVFIQSCCLETMLFLASMPTCGEILARTSQRLEQLLVSTHLSVATTVTARQMLHRHGANSNLGLSEISLALCVVNKMGRDKATSQRLPSSLNTARCQSGSARCEDQPGGREHGRCGGYDSTGEARQRLVAYRSARTKCAYACRHQQRALQGHADCHHNFHLR